MRQVKHRGHRSIAIARRALCVAAFAGASLGAQAPITRTIDARVVDQAGHGIAGAQASLAPLGRHGASDDEGRLQFADLDPGMYVISVRRIGFEPKSAKVELSAATRDTVARITITLTAIPRVLDSVRVTEKRSGLRYSAVVLDQYDRPVPGAEVIAMGIKSDVVTDSAGHFSIGGIGRGAVIVRARKMGYSPALQSMRMLADRSDTLRMVRLATSLTPVQINEASGFGRDWWAYRDLQQRMAWKSPRGGAISREELDARGTQDLCDALPGTASGVHYSIHNDPKCKSFPDGIKNILVDGARCTKGLLADYVADEVEMVEFVPADRLSKITMGSLTSRSCGPPTYVIWMRKPALVDSGPPANDVPRSIVGTVYDSLLSRPLAGARVHLADLSRETIADSLGAFRFDSVGVGVHALWADHPAIDRIGLFTVVDSVDATPNVLSRETLAIPSFATLWKRACRGEPADSRIGFIYGRVLLGAAPAAAVGQPVRAVWRTSDSAPASAPKIGRESVADSKGSYAICGVPVDQPLALSAGRGDTATTPSAFLVGDARVARRDITMPTSLTLSQLEADSAGAAPLMANDGAILVGALVDSAGKPVPSARITISGVAGQWGVTSDGTFAVRGVPSGAHVVAITVVGFLQERRVIEVEPADSVHLDVAMTRLATTMNTVKVTAERARMAARLEDLDRRHRAGFGYWSDSLKIAKAVTMTQVLTFPRVIVSSKAGQWSITMVSGVQSLPQGSQGGSQLCTPTYWLDGEITDAEALNDVSKDEIAFVEIYPTAARAPAQYAGTRSNCGVVLFWSKRYVNP